MPETETGRSASNPTQPQPEAQRIRFARRELTRALQALEAVDREQFDYAMRCLELEDQVADIRATLHRTMEARDVLSDLLTATGDERARKLTEALRVYAAVGR